MNLPINGTDTLSGKGFTQDLFLVSVLRRLAYDEELATNLKGDEQLGVVKPLVNLKKSLGTVDGVVMVRVVVS